MADLPKERLMSGKPTFTFVGADCFEPFLVRCGRAQEKRYGCLFTCFSTLAVHIKMLIGFDNGAFINTLNRFTYRKVVPLKIRFTTNERI